MNIKDFNRGLADGKILGHVSKAIQIYQECACLNVDEISVLKKIERQLKNRNREFTKEVGKMPFSKYQRLRARKNEQDKRQWFKDEECAGMSMPPTLFRVIKEYLAVENHLLGKLLFQSPAYFREVEGIRQDRLEGIGSYELPEGIIHNDLGDKTPILSAFMLCFGEQAESLKKFGGFCLKVSSPLELKRRVENHLPCGSKVEWKKVKYDKKWDMEVDVGPTEHGHRKYYAKPEKFAEEKEWRLMIFLPPPLRLLNKTLEVHVGNLQGVFQSLKP